MFHTSKRISILLSYSFKILMNVVRTLMAVLRHVLTTLGLSCALVVQDILLLMMIQAVMVSAAHYSTMIDCVFGFKMLMNAPKILMVVIKCAQTTMALSCVLVLQDILLLMII